MTSSRVKRLSLDAMLLALAMVLSYIEAILPLSLALPLPGAKLGLANIAVTLCFCMISPADAFAVSMTRIFLTSLLFGSISSFWFSLAGGMLAYLGLWIARPLKNKVTYYGISVMCAALHNVGQCLAAAVLLGDAAILSYLPLLLISAVLFGLVMGAIITPLSKMRIFKNA